MKTIDSLRMEKGGTSGIFVVKLQSQQDELAIMVESVSGERFEIISLMSLSNEYDLVKTEALKPAEFGLREMTNVVRNI